MVCYNPNMETLVTINQYAEIVKLSRRQVQRKIANKTVKAYRDPKDKHWLILVELTNLTNIH